MAAHVKKTRWTLPIALLSTLSGIIASVLLAKRFSETVFQNFKINLKLNAT